MNLELAELRERLRKVNELRESEAYRDILLPHFAELKKNATNQAIDRKITPEKRAEWIEAISQAESLERFLETEVQAIERKIAGIKK
jgi:hypothetical protein